MHQQQQRQSQPQAAVTVAAEGDQKNGKLKRRSNNKDSSVAASLTKKQQSSVRRAIKSKKIIKSELCELCFCENNRMHGHHIDYKQALNVIWLCPKCHKQVHMYENLVKEKFGFNNIIK